MSRQKRKKKNTIKMEKTEKKDKLGKVRGKKNPEIMPYNLFKAIIVNS